MLPASRVRDNARQNPGFRWKPGRKTLTDDGDPVKHGSSARTLFVAIGLAFAAQANAAVVSGAVSHVSPDTGLPGGSFVLLSAPPAAVGNDDININDTLFAFNEKQNVAFGGATRVDTAYAPIGATTRVSSHFIYFDTSVYQHIKGSITFDGAIVGIYYRSSRLQMTERAFGLDAVDYHYAPASGLEADDRPLSVIGNTLTLDWQTRSPGDHIRVLTAAVPEPESYVLFAAGLGLLATVIGRRQRQ